MANWPGYRAIKAESDRLGLPLHYRTDLTIHDRRVLLRQDAPLAFGWLVRECGTDILLPGSWWSQFNAWYYSRGADGARFYWYENEVLTAITADEMIARLDTGGGDEPVYHPHNTFN